MIQFFQTASQHIYAVQSAQALSEQNIQKLGWLFGNARLLEQQILESNYIGPRREMIRPGAPMPWRLPKIWAFAAFCV